MNWTEAYLLADMEAEEMMRAEMTDSEMLALIRALLPDTYSESKDWRTGNVTERIICLKAWLESKTEEVDRFIDILNDNRTEAQAAEIERLRGELAKEIEEKLDAISTLDAWFDRRKLAHDSLDQAVVDAASGYLRTSRCGGMKQKDSDLVLAVIQNMARLSVFADLFARSTLADLTGDNT